MKFWGFLKDLIRDAHPAIYRPPEPTVSDKVLELNEKARKRRNGKPVKKKL